MQNLLYQIFLLQIVDKQRKFYLIFIEFINTNLDNIHTSNKPFGDKRKANPYIIYAYTLMRRLEIDDSKKKNRNSH